MVPPSNLDEMVKFIEYKKKVDLECSAKKEEINVITENVLVLGKLSLYIIFILHFYIKRLCFILIIYRQTRNTDVRYITQLVQ